ncbi:NAD-dependent epimerase/dehydratase family protein [Pseudonocardia sp. GCM10023141]|uniref:NAD-dependent epimerase/dehydratase family protein n=1 Tax=Pseudonocardia sp. GCM10023141 TaxID=3252653 RepID=UPI00360A5F8E
MTTIVLGGTGFIGLHAAQEILDKGERVVLTTHRRNHETPAVRAAVERGDAVIEPVDISDKEQLFALVAKHRPDSILDITGYPPKELSPAQEISTRISNYVNMFEAAREYDVPRLTLTSSFDVYYGLDAALMPFREDQLVPLQEAEDNYMVQSWAKKTLEVVASMYRRQTGLRIVTVRPSGAYGPMYRTFLNVPSRLVRAAARGEAPDFSDRVDGVPLAEFGYDQLYVKDVGRAISAVHLEPKPKHTIYNVGAGEVLTNGRVLEAVQKAVPGFGCELAERAPGSELPLGMVVDTTRIREEFGFAPRYSVDEAVAEYVDWLRANPI